MFQRYESRRFFRSPRISSPSMDNLSPNCNQMTPKITTRDVQITKQQSNLILNCIDRINALQANLAEEKVERINDYYKLSNLLRQKQCKHNSIIYDSEIRYNRINSPGPIKQAKQDEKEKRKKNQETIRLNKNGPLIKAADANTVERNKFVALVTETQPLVQLKEAIHLNKTANHEQIYKQIYDKLQSKIKSQMIRSQQLLQKQNNIALLAKLQHQLVNMQQSLGAKVTLLCSQMSCSLKNVEERLNAPTKINDANPEKDELIHQVQTVNYRIQQAFNVINELQNEIKSRYGGLQQQQQDLDNKIQRISSMIQSDYSTIYSKVEDVEKYWTLKFETNAKQLQKMQQQIVNTQKQKNITVQMLKQLQSKLCQVFSNKMGAHMGILKQEIWAQNYEIHTKIQQNLINIILQHISSTEILIRKIEDEHNKIAERYSIAQNDHGRQ